MGLGKILKKVIKAPFTAPLKAIKSLTGSSKPAAAPATPGLMSGGVVNPATGAPVSSPMTGKPMTPEEMTGYSSQLAQTRADMANRPDQTDMYGNKVGWSQSQVRDPTTGQMVTKWDQKTTLAPDQQRLLDADTNIKKGLMGTAEGLTGQVNQSLSQPMDWSKMQSWGTAPTAGGLMAGNLQAGPELKAGNLQAGNLDPNAYMTKGAGQGLMAGLNTQALGNMPQGDAQERQRIENMMFDRMRPEHQQAQQGLEAKVRAMGITRGTPQWNREMQRLGDQQSRERFNAMEIGGNEMQRLFGMGMQGRQQGFNEMLGAGQFQNEAQQQAFSQGLTQNQQNFGMQRDAGQQNFDQQRLAGAQNFDQQRLAYDQNFNQQRLAGSQNFDQQQRALEQNYNQGLKSADYNNTLRGLQVAEEEKRRLQPLTELNALRQGNQVSNPQFGDFGSSNAAGGVNYSLTGANNDAAAAEAARAAQAKKQGNMSAVVGIAGTALAIF